MTEENTAIITVSSLMNEQAGTTLCSIKPEPGNKDQAKTLYNAMNNPTHRVKDYINKTICVENVLIEVNDILDEETGEIVKTPRTVLISPDGTSYSATSKGIFTSIKNAYLAFGEAPWPGGIDFEVKQVSVGKGQMLTLEMA